MSGSKGPRRISIGTRFWAAGVLLAVGASCAGRALAASGGPDTFGYTWRDSTGPGVAFAWEDITATGNDVTIRADDGTTGAMPLSFTFTYYGIDYNRVAACTNGWASVEDISSDSYQNTRLPDPNPPFGTIAACFDDFRLRNAGRMWFQDLGDRAVITWDRVPFYADQTKTATFQVILHADGRIVVQYQDIQGAANSATLGIESPDDTDGLTVFVDQSLPRAGYAVEFNPPAPLPRNLDCAAAATLSCGDVVTGDLAAGAANQSAYRCGPGDFSGREQVYVVDLATPTTARFVLETLSGAPVLMSVAACNPNLCTPAPGNFLSFVNATGTYDLVVDCAAGQEGAYRLKAECLPLATTLDCSAAVPLACGARVVGDLAAGTANQDAYWCSLADFSGREQVYVVDFPVMEPSVTFTLTPLSGNPDLVVLQPCNANACLTPPGDSASITDALGTYLVVVDCRPGEEGAYELSVTGQGPVPRPVGDALRATGHGVDTVTFDWSLAGPARSGERFLVRRSDGLPGGPFTNQAVLTDTSWTDPSASATFGPPHVWFYFVRITDICGQLSPD